MPGLVLHAGTSPAKLVKQKDLCLDFFRNGTRFPKACTSIRDYVSDAYHREMTFKKTRSQNLSDQPTLLGQPCAVGPTSLERRHGERKVEMGSNTDRDRNVENHATEILRRQHRSRIRTYQVQTCYVYFLPLIVIFCHSSFCAVSSSAHSLNMSLQSDPCIVYQLSADSYCNCNISLNIQTKAK